MSEHIGHSDDRPDDTTLAGEYVLGLLAQSERAEIEVRIAADPTFARLVEDWTMRLQPLADAVPEAVPPARAWNTIETAVGGRTRTARTSLWNSVAFWRWTTALASAAALTAFILLNGALLDGARKDALVATLQSASQGSGPMLLAQVDMTTGRLIIQPAGVQLPVNRVVELWVIPADGRPRSLGVIADTRASDMPMPGPAMPYLVADAMLAVSIEPMGGSPTGQPTGPVVASGKLQKI
jgi:anti-sigma-K factor RskA